MKKSLFIVGLASLALFSCKKNETVSTATASKTPAAATHGQEGVVDEDSAPDIVKLAAGNKDLSTLVTAVDKAGLTTSLSNAGPFAVFAPVNAILPQ